MDSVDEAMKEDYKIEFVDRVLDPVHGFIDLTQVEKEIIELPIFKRMQSLKQLSLTNWIFPGAEHTRYMHSLGVMFIADQMAMNLRDVTSNCLRYSDGERQLLRLAGLLHDIGHYPLSHVGEDSYKKDNLLKEDSNLSTINNKAKKSIDKIEIDTMKVPRYMESRYTIAMHHEKMGADIIANNEEIEKIIHRYCPFVDLGDISDIVVGNTEQVESKPYLSAMIQIIHSEVDADGIDYIMRDATFSGTSYGGFELGLLLRNLVVTKFRDVEIVGIRPKGISAVDQYLISKYFSYTQVIFNRHVAIYDAMAVILTRYLINSKDMAYPSARLLQGYVNNHHSEEDYLRFTDRFFWTQVDSLREELMLKNNVPLYIIKIVKKLQHYQEFETADKGQVIITSNDYRIVQSQLTNSEIYKHISDTEEDKLILYHMRGFTNQIRESEFISRIQMNKGWDVNEPNFVKEFIKRLQEGVAVIEDGKKIKLLVDDPRSIMSALHTTRTYILREYNVY